MIKASFFSLALIFCSYTSFSQPASEPDKEKTKGYQHSAQLTFLPISGVSYAHQASPMLRVAAGLGYVKANIWLLGAIEATSFSAWSDVRMLLKEREGSEIYWGPFLAYRYQYAIASDHLFRVLIPLPNLPAYKTEIRRSMLTPGLMAGIRLPKKGRFFMEAQAGLGLNIFLEAETRAIDCENPEDCAVLNPLADDLPLLHFRSLFALGYSF